MAKTPPRGYLALRRVLWADEYPEGGAARRQPAVSLSPSQVGTLYRGFDGAAWPADVFASIPKNEWDLIEESQLKQAMDALGRLKLGKQHYDLIYLAGSGRERSFGPMPSGELLGFDCGHYSSSMDKYSVLLHEVLFGKYPQLRAFGRELNEHLLFPNPDIDLLTAARENLLRSGADLETDTDCQPYAIVDVHGAR